MAMTFNQIRNMIKNPEPKVVLNEALMPRYEEEEVKKREWQISDLNGDFSTHNIVSNLTNTERYTFHKSGKKLRLLFQIIGKDLENQYLNDMGE